MFIYFVLCQCMYVVFFFGYTFVFRLKRRKINNLFPSTTQSETNVEKVHIISFLFHSLFFLNIYAGKDGAHCFPKLFLSELGVWYLIDISDNPTSIGHNCDILNLLLFQFSTIKCGQYLLGMKVKSMLSCFFFFLFCFAFS